MNILQELWYGNIRPNEDKVITDEEKELIQLIARHHEKLSSSLKNNDLVIAKIITLCYNEIAKYITSEYLTVV